LKTIVYLHGFTSSPRSKKAVMLGDYLKNVATGVAYAVPELHHRPSRAIEEAARACEGIDAADLTLVGSSLGGFYATVLAERLGCRAALLNPAVRPHEHFASYLGPQRNMYTGEEFELTRAHIDDLRSMQPRGITRPERYWLFVETGDVVCDYRDATAFYGGALHTVVRGGDHTLVSFPEHVPDIVEWAKS
jgi:predicted esterase YcpF (UPF0227 family)